MGDTRIKGIIIHGLRPKYRGFVAAVQGRPTQPSLVKFENFLVDQEVMVKQIKGLSLKGEKEGMYTNKTEGNYKHHNGGGYKRDCDIVKGYQGEDSSHLGGAPKNREIYNQFRKNRRFEGKCYNCGKMVHMTKDCWLNKKHVKSTTVIFNSKDKIKED